MNEMTGHGRSEYRPHINKKHGELPPRHWDDQSSTRIHGEKTDEFYSTYKSMHVKPQGHGIGLQGRRDKKIKEEIMREVMAEQEQERQQQIAFQNQRSFETTNKSTFAWQTSQEPLGQRVMQTQDGQKTMLDSQFRVTHLTNL